MADLQAMSPDEIIKHLNDAGSVERAAVEALSKRLHEDWVITADEAEMLFQIQQQVGDHPENCPTWTQLYVEAISRFVVMDMETPGEISPAEAAWLRKHIAAEPGELSQTESKLLNQVRSLSGKWCPSLEPFFAQAASQSAATSAAQESIEAETE